MQKNISKTTETIVKHNAVELKEKPEYVFVKSSRVTTVHRGVETLAPEENSFSEENNEVENYTATCVVEKSDFLSMTAERFFGYVTNPITGVKDMIVVALTSEDIADMQDVKTRKDPAYFNFLAELSNERALNHYPLKEGESLYLYSPQLSLLTTIDGKVVPLPLRMVIEDDSYELLEEVVNKIQDNPYVLECKILAGWNYDHEISIICLFPQETMQTHIEDHGGKTFATSLILQELELKECLSRDREM